MVILVKRQNKGPNGHIVLHDLGGGVESPLQRHQPSKQSHASILLIYATMQLCFYVFCFLNYLKKENYFGDMYGDGPDKKGPHDWTSMGPKGIKEALALFLSYDKSNGSWLKQDSNPPPPI